MALFIVTSILLSIGRLFKTILRTGRSFVGRSIDLDSLVSGSDDTDVIAVLPFEVVGSDSIAWLGVAIPEFISLALTGQSGPRAVSHRTVLGAWERARQLTVDRAERIRRVARDVGASRVIVGQVIQQPNGVLAQAELIRAETREILAEASATGQAGQEVNVAEELGGQLLAASAGEFARLSGLVSSSTEAIQAWLAGQEAFRAGDFEAAVLHYERAVDADTTFALAAYAMMIADGWATTDDGQYQRGRRLAWQHQDRLPRPDSLLFVAESYRNCYPPPCLGERAALALYEQAIQEYPDRWDVWTRYGDWLWHDGGVFFEDAVGQAVAAFETALALDSVGHIEPGFHLGEHFLAIGDLDAYDRLHDRYKNGFTDWLAGVGRGDRTVIDSALIAIPDYDHAMLWEKLAKLQHMSAGMEVVEMLAAELERRAFAGDDRAAGDAAMFYLNAGRPARATPLIEIQLDPLSAWLLPAAMYEGADTALAARAARDVERRVGLSTASELASSISDINARCYLEHWRMHEGDFETAGEAVTLLRQVAANSGVSQRSTNLAARCALTLEAWHLTKQGDPGALAAMQLADSAGALGGLGWFTLLYNNLRLASLYEYLGRDRDALRMVRRRGQRGAERIVGIAIARLGEARLAARLGRPEEAIKAYNHYLWLRYDPEPALEAEVTQARRELAELVGEG